MMRESKHGFALVELVIVVVVATVLASLLLVMGDGARRHARLGEDLSNIRQIGTLTQAYGADFNDLMWSYSWRPGNYTTQWPDLQHSTSAIDAAAKQAVAIMRERGGITIGVISGWVPHVMYNHLPLIDYADRPLPDRMFVSAGDRHRLEWAADPECFLTNCFPCQPSMTSNVARRWLFSASYAVGPAFYDRSPAGMRLSPGVNWGFVFVPGGVDLGGAALSGVAHPSEKVILHSMHQWHYGKRQPIYFMPEARVPLLMSDGSAGVRMSGESNLGANPNHWSSTTVPQYTYAPSGCWEPAAVTGGQDVGYVRYRWTRMGIGGRDFGGPEVWP